MPNTLKSSLAVTPFVQREIVPLETQRSNSRPSERVYPDDDVFFHKGQIKIGTQLWHYGRLDPKSLWQVVKIMSYVFSNGMATKPRKVEIASKLLDTVYLRRIGSDIETRSVTFSTLSYSALWRIAHK